MTWTQPLCEHCWWRQHPNRVPVTIVRPDIEVCCECGELTVAGIYVRRDPDAVPYPRKD